MKHTPDIETRVKNGFVVLEIECLEKDCKAQYEEAIPKAHAEKYGDGINFPFCGECGSLNVGYLVRA